MKKETKRKWRRYLASQSSAGNLAASAVGFIPGHAYMATKETGALARMERAGRRGSKVKAAQSLAKKRPWLGKAALPKDKATMQRLAKRGKLKNIGHAALRSGVPGGPTRYLAKASYARSGYHRNEEAELIAAVIEAEMEERGWV